MRLPATFLALAISPCTALACTLNFTSPSDGATTRTANITVYGQGGASAQFGNFGTVTATLNGTPFYNYSGSFTAAVTFLQSRGVPVTLRPGINVLAVTGSVGSCSASDSMTIMYDPEVTLSKNKGTPPPNTCTGNPINLAIGNKFQRETDFSSSSSPLLRFDRIYNSLDGYWRHNLSTRLVITSSEIRLVEADGRETLFSRSGTTITAPSDELGTLVAEGAGWRYTSTSQMIYIFDNLGKLVSQQDASGRSISLSHSALETVVTSDTGETLTFTSDAKLQPLKLTASNVSTIYNHDAQGRLQTVTRTISGATTSRTFHYENQSFPRFLTGITDENGDRYVTWTYDQFGRATSSARSGDVEKTTISYNADGTSTVTNPLGKNTTYHFAVIQGVKKITAIDGEASANCPSSNSTFTYDDRGLLKTKTDNKGNLTTYTYNARGLEISRTEASGTPQARTITTDWHADLFLPVKVTEPDRITQYSYDAQGRQISQSVNPR